MTATAISSASAVGALSLPLAAGTTNSAIADPLISGLLSYLAYCLGAALDTKLANLHGTSSQAVPAANRFPWDPAGYCVRGREDGAPNPFPALYVWRQGAGKREAYSTVLTMRRVTVAALYVFDELVLPGALEDRFGLRSAVDAVFHSAASNGFHPSYGHDGAPPGTPIRVSLQLAGQGLNYEGGTEGLMAPVPGQSQAMGRSDDGHVVRAYPTLMGTFTAWEMIGQYQPVDPTNATPGLTATVSTNGTGDDADGLTLLSRILPAPDGSEQQGTS
jgi:hypothetical protein